jgi:hypothetical protein
MVSRRRVILSLSKDGHEETLGGAIILPFDRLRAG